MGAQPGNIRLFIVVRLLPGKRTIANRNPLTPTDSRALTFWRAPMLITERQLLQIFPNAGHRAGFFLCPH